MQDDKKVETEEEDGGEIVVDEPAEGAEHQIPGIEYYDEPDAENIMPAEDRPGTL